jgi:hypothetical protein
MPSKRGRAFLDFLLGELFLGISPHTSGENHPVAEGFRACYRRAERVSNILQPPQGKIEYSRLIALDLAAR